MTQHLHSTVVQGCYRCDIGRDEELTCVARERDDLEALAKRLARALEEEHGDGEEPDPVACPQCSALSAAWEMLGEFDE